MKSIKKAVIPVAGFGTRFLPYTKAVPKAMLPILNKPAIQIIVEEVVASGIEEICFIVGYKKQIIENHFKSSKKLENELNEKHKINFLKEIKIPETLAKFTYIEQKSLNGTAKAIELAKDFVGSDPFAILFGDDVMYNEGTPVIKQLIDVYEKTGKTVLGCKNVKKEDVVKYASVEYSSIKGNVYDVTKITEKPKFEEIKSTLSPLGRYVVTNSIFDAIKEVKQTMNREYQITDAFDILAKNEGVKALLFDGKRYDMGNRLGFLKANIEFALRDEELSSELREYLKNL